MKDMPLQKKILWKSKVIGELKTGGIGNNRITEGLGLRCLTHLLVTRKSETLFSGERELHLHFE